jgi:hypothetical protein
MLTLFLVDIGSSLIINKINIYHLLFALNIYLYQRFLSCSTVIYSSRYISSGKCHIDLEFLFSYEKKKISDDRKEVRDRSVTYVDYGRKCKEKKNELIVYIK